MTRQLAAWRVMSSAPLSLRTPGIAGPEMTCALDPVSRRPINVGLPAGETTRPSNAFDGARRHRRPRPCVEASRVSTARRRLIPGV